MSSLLEIGSEMMNYVFDNFPSISVFSIDQSVEEENKLDKAKSSNLSGSSQNYNIKETTKIMYASEKYVTHQEHVHADLVRIKHLLESCEYVLRRSNPPIYQLPLKVLHEENMCRTLAFGEENYKPMKTILVVGATGAGKSTLINAFINYILNISWTDDFRVRLIQEPIVGGSQAFSQTSMITAYKIYHQDHFRIPYSLTIIDTPGFGDTSGIERDWKITRQLSEYFKSDASGINSIDAVGFVAESTRSRLTPTQEYIFHSILSLFGRDIVGNIFMLLTFADGQKPPILAALTEADLPYEKFFKFNNSALYADNNQVKQAAEDDDESDEDNFDHMFWKMGASSYKKFMNSLLKAETKSLTMTKDVLAEREKLEVRVDGIQKEITSGLNKLDQLKVEFDMLLENEVDIYRNKNFKYTIKEEFTVRIVNDTGVYVTNCRKCNRTCHKSCAYADDGDKYKCSAMEGSSDDTYCTVCPGGCMWDIHHNMEYRLEIEEKEVIKTSKDLYRRYQEASGKQLNHQELVDEVIADIEATELNTAALANDVRKSIVRLQEIALKPNPLSNVDYIDLLIKSENDQRKLNWATRVEYLQAVRNQAIIMAEISRPDYDPYEEYKKLYIEEKKKGKHKKLLKSVCSSFKTLMKIN